MTDQNSETKDKIIQAARSLFAQQGFEGTSVREIAKAAEVNVASLNYHFSSKENLFSEILRIGYVECSSAVRGFYEAEKPSLEETLLFLFRYFIEKSDDLLAYFKMMMSSQHNHHMTAQGTGDELLGPPGGRVIAEAILGEVGVIPEEDLHWGLRALFTHVVHTSLMYNCCFKNNELPFSALKDIEAGIRRLTRVVLQDLRRFSSNR